MSGPESGCSKVTSIVAFATLAVTIASLVMLATDRTGGGKPRGAASFRRIRLFNGGVKKVNANVVANINDSTDPKPFASGDVNAKGTWILEGSLGSPLYAQAEILTVIVKYDGGEVLNVTYTDPDNTNTTDCHTELDIFVASDGSTKAFAWHAQIDQMMQVPIPKP